MWIKRDDGNPEIMFWILSSNNKRTKAISSDNCQTHIIHWKITLMCFIFKFSRYNTYIQTHIHFINKLYNLQGNYQQWLGQTLITILSLDRVPYNKNIFRDKWTPCSTGILVWFGKLCLCHWQSFVILICQMIFSPSHETKSTQPIMLI